VRHTQHPDAGAWMRFCLCQRLKIMRIERFR